MTDQITKKVRLRDLQQWKSEGKRWAMVTAYDFSTARVFDKAGIPVLLVGDSAANVIYGYPTTTSISFDELAPLAAAVVRGAPNSYVIADLPFGTYEASDTQAVESAVDMIRTSGADAVKIEGGSRIAPRIKALADAGISVCAHIGFTPQSVSSLSGFRVQGRGDGRDQLRADAHAVAEAGACAVVMEMVPADLAAEITEELSIPTIGIGAGNTCDAQVLVWHDMAGFNERTPRFVRQFGAVADSLEDAARKYRLAVADGSFPASEHEFE